MADADWTEHAAAILGALEPPHAAKKRATIIALVNARLEGKTEESVWKDPSVCNRATYHNKWKKDRQFAEALRTVTEFAQGWKNQRSARALKEAADRLAMLAGPAVTVLGRSLTSSDEAIALRAAFGVLDRAGIETANKTETVQISTNLEEWRADVERRRGEIDAMLEENIAAEADAEQHEGETDE